MPYIERLLAFFHQPFDFFRHRVGISFFFFSTVVLLPRLWKLMIFSTKRAIPFFETIPPRGFQNFGLPLFWGFFTWHHDVLRLSLILLFFWSIFIFSSSFGDVIRDQSSGHHCILHLLRCGDLAPISKTQVLPSLLYGRWPWRIWASQASSDVILAKCGSSPAVSSPSRLSCRWSASRMAALNPGAHTAHVGDRWQRSLMSFGKASECLVLRWSSKSFMSSRLVRHVVGFRRMCPKHPWSKDTKPIPW